MPRIPAPPTSTLVAALVLCTIVAALLGWFCYRLLVDRGHLLLRLQQGAPPDARARRQARGLPAGAYLANFALPAPDGAMMTLSELAGRPLLLAFLRADCLYSRAFARELASLPLASAAPLTLAVVTGDIDEAETLSAFPALRGVLLLDRHGQVARLMQIVATPSGYLIDDQRRTVGRQLAGPVALVAAARGDAVAESEEGPLPLSPLPATPSARRAPLAPGSAAPDFTLPMLHGGEWSLAAHRGERLTLIFSDPMCPPCTALFAELGSRANTGVVIVSRGDAGENRHLVAATRVAAPLLLQRQREVARAYRTLETPSAYRLDERGEIMAGPAIGKEAVLALIDQTGPGYASRHTG